MMAVMRRFDKMHANPLSNFHSRELLFGVSGGIELCLVAYDKTLNAKKFRHGVEYGSVGWETAKDIESYVNLVFENNMLLMVKDRD